MIDHSCCSIVTELIGRKKKVQNFDPRNWDVTAWYQSLGTRIPKTRWETGLDHAFIMHFDKPMHVIYA